MARKYSQEELEIRNEIRDYLRTYARTFCQEAAKELTKTAKYAIKAFYDDYEPNWYKRDENLLKNSYKHYYHDNGRRVAGGVKISDEDMNPYYKRIKKGVKEIRDPFLVVESAWDGGWHGIYGMYTAEHRMSPTPLEIVKDKMEDEIFLSDAHEKATKKANSKSYKHISLK